MIRRPPLLTPLLATLLMLVLAPPAAARPSAPITTPGGLRPDRTATAATTGDCELDGVTCRPTMAGSCTGYTSQNTPPGSIRVLVRTGTTTTEIKPLPFMQYVDNVLPNEWVPSWDGDALKAGAVAVKSYAWYWVTHFGGYVGSDPKDCFDVTDDSDFQVYKADSETARTTEKVTQSWPVVARRNGAVIQTSYRAYLKSASEACGAYSNGTAMSQYGTQACNEANTGNKYNVILGKYYYPGLQLATARQERTQHDFTFEQTSTRITYNTANWSIDDGYPTSLHYGTSGDIPAITDNGDGFAHIGVFRPSTGYWYQASPTGVTAAKTLWGHPGDIPVAGHYSGLDKPSVLAVFRPSTKTWWVRGRSSAVYGLASDKPVPGDYDGNGTTDIAVWRPSNGTWYIGSPTGTSTQITLWGRTGDIPAPADYNGDGKTDLAIYRPSTHQFWIRGQAPVTYGTTGDIPVTGDFTGDGHADICVYRPSTHTWYVKGQASRAFGSGTPIGAAPYRG